MRRGYLIAVIAALLLPLFAAAKGRPLVLYQDREFAAGRDSLPGAAVFLECTFSTDGKPVLAKADGAVFLGCTFLCGSDTLFLAETGDGMAMVNCTVFGTAHVEWSAAPKESDRNYLYDLNTDSDDSPGLYDCPQTVDIEGLRLADAYIFESEDGQMHYNIAGILGRYDMETSGAERFLGRSLSGLPLRMTLQASDYGIECGSGKVVTVHAVGLDQDMFIGWTVSDGRLVLAPSAEYGYCNVSVADGVDEDFSATVTACTEYGLEQALTLSVRAKPVPVEPETKKKGRLGRRKKR